MHGACFQLHNCSYVNRYQLLNVGDAFVETTVPCGNEDRIKLIGVVEVYLRQFKMNSFEEFVSPNAKHYVKHYWRVEQYGDIPLES